MKKSKQNKTVMAAVYVSGIPESLKRKAKKAAIDNGIKFQDFIKIAIEHYLEYIESGRQKKTKLVKQAKGKIDLFFGERL